MYCEIYKSLDTLVYVFKHGWKGQVLPAVFAEASNKQVKTLLQISSKEQVLDLSEVAANLLQGNIPVDSNQKTKLKRFKSFYRELASKGVQSCRLVKNSKQIGLLLSSAKSVLLQL